MGALVGGQVSPNLADDYRVAGFTGLDDIDAQAIPSGAGPLSDVRRNAALFVFMPNMVFAMEALDGVGRGIRDEVM